MAPEALQEIADAYKLMDQGNRKFLEVWLEHMLWTWQFWLCVTLTTLPWVLWFMVRQRESADRLLYAGFLVLIIAAWLDFAGVTLGLWRYNIEVLPVIPSFVPWDFSVIPVTTMLFLQVRPGVSPWFKAALFAALGAFVVEPLFVLLGIYQPVRWEHIYSFPIYGVVYLLAHRVSRWDSFAPIGK